MTGDGTSFNRTGKPAEALFVHGMFLGGQEAFWLALGLARHRIRLRRFRYRSRAEAPEAVVARLAERLETFPDLHLVAHSFGGVLSLAAMSQAPQWRGRAVLLGAPVQGSRVARRTLELPGGALMLGKAADWLTRGLEEFAVPRGRVLVIAGTLNVGVGRLLAAASPEGDGIVNLEETELENAAGSLRFNTFHLGLVYHPGVIERVAGFIGDGA